MPVSRFAVCVALSLSACGVGAPPASDELTETFDPVVRGTTQPTALTLTARQKLAVGAVLDGRDGWSNECTGTLIAPTLAVTAAHCVEGLRASDLAFAIGDDAASPRQSVVATAVYTHPGYDPSGDAEDDVAVLRFAAPVTLADPIAANCDAPSGTLVGKKLQTGGYGETLTNDENTRRYWAAVTLRQIGSYDLTTYGNGSGACYGDSGGPLLAVVGGEPKLVGTLSWGEQCGYEDHYTRVDTVCSFLRSIPGFASTATPAPGPAPSTGGSSQTLEGVAFTADQASKALQLANTATQSKLDVDVGLDARAAGNIVAARPFSSLAAVAAVPYVGAAALTRLRDF